MPKLGEITSNTELAIGSQPAAPLRTPVFLAVNHIAAVATEALAAYTALLGGADLGTATTNRYTVTAGKVFRVQSLTLVAQGTALGTLRARLRAGQTVSATSPVTAAAAVVTPANGGGTVSVPIPDGVEIPGGQQVGISVVGLTSQTYSAFVIGYEYLPS